MTPSYKAGRRAGGHPPRSITVSVTHSLTHSVALPGDPHLSLVATSSPSLEKFPTREIFRERDSSAFEKSTSPLISLNDGFGNTGAQFLNHL